MPNWGGFGYSFFFFFWFWLLLNDIKIHDKQSFAVLLSHDLNHMLMRVGGWLEYQSKSLIRKWIKLTSHHSYHITLQLHCSVVASALMLNVHLGFTGESNCYTFEDYQSAWGASQVAVVVKNPLASAGDIRDAGLTLRKIPWRRKWQPTPVFLPGESHGQRIRAGYSPWGQTVGLDWSALAHMYRVLETGPLTDLSILSINHSKCSCQLLFSVIMPPHL